MAHFEDCVAHATLRSSFCVRRISPGFASLGDASARARARLAIILKAFFESPNREDPCVMQAVSEAIYEGIGEQRNTLFSAGKAGDGPRYGLYGFMLEGFSWAVFSCNSVDAQM